MVLKAISESELMSHVPALWEQIKSKPICLLYGEMGSGKTSLVRALGRYLGFKNDTGSPSFSLINEYHYKDENQQSQILFHMDLFRLKKIEEALDIGIEEYLYSCHLCIIEWPELILPLIHKKDYLEIHIEFLENHKRNYTLITK